MRFEGAQSAGARIRRRGCCLLALAVLAALSLYGCGRDEGGEASNSPPPPASASQPGSQSPANSPEPDAGGPANSPEHSDEPAGGGETPTSSPEQPPEEPSQEPSDPANGETTVTLYPGVESTAMLEETEDMGQEYIDGITFLGDSTTYGLKYYRMLADGRETTQVWTPKSGTLSLFQQSFALIVYPETGEEITILEAVERKKPEMMVITLGVNGVSMMDEDYFKSEYTSLVTGIQEKSPDTKIILQSIFPVAASYEYLGSINNEKITRANQWVAEVAEDTGVRYLDTQTVLAGEDGWLPESYQNGDGLHLNETSFGLVLDYIRTHGYQ